MLSFYKLCFYNIVLKKYLNVIKWAEDYRRRVGEHPESNFNIAGFTHLKDKTCRIVPVIGNI